jgi:hypothetical protein
MVKPEERANRLLTQEAVHGGVAVSNFGVSLHGELLYNLMPKIAFPKEID